MNSDQQYQHGSLPQPVADSDSGFVQKSAPAPQAPQTKASQQQDVSRAMQPLPPQPIAPVAQESDVIDPAWIAQVDTTIKNSVADPRALSREFAKLKAQYVSSRYGHDIKQSSEKG